MFRPCFCGNLVAKVISEYVHGVTIGRKQSHLLAYKLVNPCDLSTC